MRTILGLLSLLCFAALAVSVLFLIIQPFEKLNWILAVVISGGLAVVFRGLRARMV